MRTVFSSLDVLRLSFSALFLASVDIFGVDDFLGTFFCSEKTHSSILFTVRIPNKESLTPQKKSLTKIVMHAVVFITNLKEQK